MMMRWPFGIVLLSVATLAFPACSTGPEAAHAAPVDPPSVPLYAKPDFGFAGCAGDIAEYYVLGPDRRGIAIVLPRLGACAEGPFSDALGVYLEEPAGWRLIFSGDYNPAVNAVDRGGRNRRLFITSRTGGPRLTFEARDRGIVLVTDGGEVVAPERSR